MGLKKSVVKTPLVDASILVLCMVLLIMLVGLSYPKSLEKVSLNFSASSKTVRTAYPEYC